MPSKYFLKLDQFEGPLDLLLHLIRVHEISIFDIDIFLLTKQYLSYLRVLKFRDLSDSGEFFQMAATLIEIKSRMLLPRQSADGSMGDDDEDPRMPLQQRLIEYERYKAVSEYMAQLPILGVQIQASPEWKRLEPIYEEVETPITGDSAALCVLFETMLRTLTERRAAKVEAKTHLITLEETIFRVDELLETIRFALFQGFYHKFNNRYELVVHILALLELAKSGKIKLFQQDLLGPLWMYRSDISLEDLPLTAQQRAAAMIEQEAQELTVPTSFSGVQTPDATALS